MTTSIGIIRDINFGCRGTDHPCLWFYMQTLGMGIWMVFKGQKALDFLKDHSVYSMSELEGAPCIVEEVDATDMYFRRLLRPPKRETMRRDCLCQGDYARGCYIEREKCGWRGEER